MALIRPAISPVIDLGDPHTKAELKSAPRLIEFRHPAYPDEAKALLELPALDHDSCSRGRDIGIDYDFALAACGIITGNRWSGSCFSQRELATQQIVRIERPNDGLLRGDRYYFHPEGEHLDGNTEQPYPIVPSFDHWRFPHDIDLPTPWSILSIDLGLDMLPAISFRDKVLVRDASCRVSGSLLELEHAHLVPSASKLWFELNNMSRYSQSSHSFASINDYNNGIALRRDIHSLFDKRRFAIVPKSKSAAIVLHVLDGRKGGETLEVQKVYHNLPCQPITGVSLEFLFSRFAWTLFCDELLPLCRSPLQTFSVLLYNGTIRHGLSYNQVKNVANMLPTSSRSQSRSVSPKKRKKFEDEESRTAGNYSHRYADSMSPYSSSEGQSDSAGEQESFINEESRGRKRHRDTSRCSGKERVERQLSYHNSLVPSASPSLSSSADSGFVGESGTSPASMSQDTTEKELRLDDVYLVKRRRLLSP